jgi:hypothetical protein
MGINEGEEVQGKGIHNIFNIINNRKKNYKPLKKETEEHYSWWKDLPRSWIATNPLLSAM